MDALGQYLKEIAEFPLLDRDEELALIRRAERGDKAAIDKLVQHNLRLVVSIARQFNWGIPLEDRIAHGNDGLIVAANRAKSKFETRFSTYATWWIRQHIRRACQVEGNVVRIPVHLQRRDATDAERCRADRARDVQPIDDYDFAVDQSRVFEESVRNEDADYLWSRLSKLNPRLCRILLARAGGNTLESLTAELGVTRERVRQLEKQGLKKLAEQFGRERAALTMGQVLRNGGKKR